MSENSRTLFRQMVQVESAPLEGECILFLPEDNRFVHLNRTASFIWGQLREPASARAVAGALLRTFEGVTEGEAIRDVTAALDELVSMSVVEALPAPRPTIQQQGDNA